MYRSEEIRKLALDNFHWDKIKKSKLLEDQEAQKLKKEIEDRMEKAHREKAAKRKTFLWFKCPHMDIPTGKGTRCPQSYFSLDYEGAQAHLANCLHLAADVFAAYIKKKSIEIDT